ncbi:MAG: hypothetical protein VYC19_10610, partial [Pseudomonadota bacterium]|nr:hypothetical protein [Pseudomonadota bacterium]
VMTCLGKALSGGDYISAAQIRDHIAGDTSVYEALAASRADGKIAVNASIPLTEGRILQMERDNFLTLFNRESTKARMHYMVQKNKPLREGYPENRPTPNDIRGSIEWIEAKHRTPDGKPLSGADEKRLKEMSKLAQRTMWGLKKLGMV